MFPGRYRSDFAVQVTSQIAEAQKFTINFANNNLLGSANFRPGYRTSKARICVTVGMMTTGYDCTDILNLGLFRPIFSPTDFVQIKGRGIRRHDFRKELLDDTLKTSIPEPQKTAFKLFDFFGNCEYFETGFNYDEVLKLPRPGSGSGGGTGPVVVDGTYEHLGADIIASVREETIGYEGMKIDRMLFEKFGDTVRKDETIADAVMAGQWDRVIDYVNREVFDKPEEYYTPPRSCAKPPLWTAASPCARFWKRSSVSFPISNPRMSYWKRSLRSSSPIVSPTRRMSSWLSRTTSKPMPPATRYATSSTANDSPISPPTRPFPPATSPPCRTSTATSFRSTSRTTFP